VEGESEDLSFTPPSFMEQHVIVHRVNALFRVRLRLSVVVASRWCERLTQAVLGKAFAGIL